MTNLVKVLKGSEVSFMLRRELGPDRDWEYLLADMRRDRNAYHGLTLLPFGLVHDGRLSRPYYRLSDVEAFIAQAKSVNPSAAACKPIQAVLVESNIADARLWKVKRLQVIAA
jgi:hypothetical protein